MKIWKRMTSGLLTTLIVLMTLMTPAVADVDSISTTAILIDDETETISFILNTNSLVDQGVSPLDVLVEAKNTVTSQSATVTISVPAVPNDPSDPVTATFTTASLGLDIVDTHTIDIEVFDTLLVSLATDTVDVNVTTIAPDAPIAEGLIIDDIEVDSDYAPGDTVTVDVTLENDFDTDVDDVTVEAWILDGDDDRVGDKQESREFNLNDGEDEELTFSFVLPNDADEGIYTVLVEVDSDSGLLDSDFETFDVERAENSLFFDSIAFDSTVNAGDSMGFAVTLFNNGLNDEDDVKTSVTISGIGVSQTSDYYTVEEDDDAVRYFTLSLPSTTSTGTYQITFRAWNSDVDMSDTRELVVSGTSAGTITGTVGGVTTSADATSKTAYVGTGAVYTVSITNNENLAVAYTVSVAGTEGWASSSVNPSSVSLAPGTTGQISVFVSPNEGASGTQQFSVYVKEGTTIVDSVSLTANVVSEPATAIFGGFGTSQLAIILLIALLVLLILRREASPLKRVQRGRKKKDVYY